MGVGVEVEEGEGYISGGETDVYVSWYTCGVCFALDARNPVKS